MEKIKKGNEFIEVHHGEHGTFLLFGAEFGTKRVAYEINLSEDDKVKLVKALYDGVDKNK